MNGLHLLRARLWRMKERDCLSKCGQMDVTDKGPDREGKGKEKNITEISERKEKEVKRTREK